MPTGTKEIDLHVELNYLKVTAQNDPIYWGRTFHRPGENLTPKQLSFSCFHVCVIVAKSFLHRLQVVVCLQHHVQAAEVRDCQLFIFSHMSISLRNYKMLHPLCILLQRITLSPLCFSSLDLLTTHFKDRLTASMSVIFRYLSLSNSEIPSK